MSAHDKALVAAGNAYLAQGSGRFHRQIETAITAYLSHLRAAGFVVARVPNKRALPGAMGTEAALDYAQGWNACRATMLEGDKP